MDAFLQKALQYKKTIGAAIAGGAAILAMSQDGFTESELQAGLAIVVGVVTVYLARNKPQP